MNKRGQVGLLGFIILELFFVANWALWLGSLIATAGDNAITNGAVGFEAFLWSNLNLWIFCLLLLLNIVVFRYGGNQ